MKKTLKKYVICLIVFVACAIAWILSPKEVSAYAATVNSLSLNDKYYLKESFTIQEVVELKISEDKYVNSTDGVLVSPSGIAYDKGTVILNEIGEWSLEYYAKYSNKDVFAGVKITVLDGAERDTAKPIVTFEKEFTFDGGVYLALYEEFELPTATVEDENFFGDLKVAVYKNYGNDYQSQMYVKDGIFVPDEKIEYAAVYIATDAFGNEGVGVVRLKVLEEQSITYEQKKLDAIVAGERVVLPVIEAESINNDVSFAVKVTNPARESFYLNEDLSFLPEYVGEYTIAYEFSDNAYCREFSYQVRADYNGQTYFYDDIVLPPYLIKNASYSLENYYGYVVTEGGLEKRLTQVYASVDGGAFTKVSNVASYKITASNKVQFKYVYNGYEKTSEEIAVIDVGFNGQKKEYENYFVGSYKELAITKNAFEFTFDDEYVSGELNFIKEISFNNFVLAFTMAEKTSECESIQITLTDYYDENKKIVLLYSQTSEGLYLSLNGGAQKFVGDDLSGTHQISYQDGGFFDKSGVTLKTGIILNDKCLLKIEALGIFGDCVLGVSKICNQNLKSGLAEAVPQAGTLENGTIYMLGETYEVTIPTTISVFNPTQIDGTLVTVSNPDGEIVSDINGLRLEEVSADKTYTIDLLTVGVYTVKYTCTIKTGISGKNSGKTADFYASIEVLDEIPPTISFKDGVDENSVIEIEKGKVHNVKEYEITDNVSTVENLRVMIYIYDESYHLLSIDKDSFIPTKEGEYYVRIWCIDEHGNYAVASYKVYAR